MSDVALHVGAEPTLHVGVGEIRRVACSVGGEVFSPVTYRGAYSVTPTQAAQVLATAGTALTQDVTVEAIPSNYGLVSWDGSVLTVS